MALVNKANSFCPKTMFSLVSKTDKKMGNFETPG